MKESRSEESFLTGPLPLLIVISGPSGVGKDAVLARLKETGGPFEHVITVTTRTKRPLEQDGVDYRFVPADRFQDMLRDAELLEWAKVYDNWYGVPRQPVREALENGRDVVLKVDIQGAATIKKTVPQAILIFLMPPSPSELVQRLERRRTESPGDLALRIETAEAEMRQVATFDYAVVNRAGELDHTVAQIQAIITAEKCRVDRRKVSL
jgi:guanylate kinase